MTLEPGTRLGPYEIVAPLGAGGMGEVYRARDTRLGREVAIKVLPAHLSANAEVRARFEREAKTVSGLNHPNICTLFDVGREGETDYLVMELVEGETLAERLRRGPLAAAELVRFGVQIADALDRAHRAGVVHRDLKPGNVMVTRSGAKLMDFGLARAVAGAGPVSASGATMGALTQHPTVASPLTVEGAIVGTFQYMSPEQLEGREADTRSDLWAFGCVLYEMATGRRAFEGRSQASLIAAILEREPAPIGESISASGLPSAPPAGLDKLVRACLAKDPEERIQTAHDAKLQLQWLAEGLGMAPVSTLSAVQAQPVVRTAAARGGRAGWIVAGVFAAALLGFGAWAWPKLTAAPPVYRFAVPSAVPGAVESYWPRLSPDGRAIAFTTRDSANRNIPYLQRFGEPDAHPIPGAEGANRFVWSPDGHDIAFTRDGRLFRLPVAGGVPDLVCPAPGGADLSWSTKGMILLDGASTDSLRVVSARGGELAPASTIDRARHEIGAAWPSFLPDGEHFLFEGVVSPEEGHLRLGKLGSLESRYLADVNGRAEYLGEGWIAYVRGNSLVAQKLDLRAGKLVGDRVTLVDRLRIGAARGHFSTARDGSLALISDTGTDNLQLVRLDRQGHTTPDTPLASGVFANPRLSPDGERVLVERRASSLNSGGEIALLDLARSAETQLSFTGGSALRPVWSPDGRRFAYTQVVPGRPTVLRTAPADGMGQQDSLVLDSRGYYLTQWHAGSNTILAHETSRYVGWRIDMNANPPLVRALVDSTSMRGHAVVSPDGRFVASVEGQSSNFAIYVTSLGGEPGRWLVGSPRSMQPRWTKGGRELLFEASDGHVMSVDIDAGTSFHAGMPKALFALPLSSQNPENCTWDVDASGERFLAVRRTAMVASGTKLEVVTNFRSLMPRR
ncbi:MAG: protein kinase [Candidatus Eisenbacteria bacterium]